MSHPERSEGSVNAKGGFWSFETLLRRHHEVFGGNQLDIALLHNKAEICVDTLVRKEAGYRLHVGSEIYVSPRSPDIDPALQTRRYLADRESTIIPPGQFAFLTTKERIKIPEDAVGLIGLRASVKFRGLVNVSGFHADPGYDNHLVFAVFNAGPAAIHVGCGEAWFHLMLVTLDGGKHLRRDPEFEAGKTILTSGQLAPVSGQFRSLEALDARLNKLERDHAVVRWGIALIASAVITGAVAFLIDRLG